MERVEIGKFVRLFTIAAEARKLAFLVGAGVSMLPPTSLPSGPALKDLALSSIANIPELKECWDELRSSPKYNSIVPEILFQRVWEYLGDGFLPFFQVLRLAEPNLAHKVLGHFFVHFEAPVITTNFDLYVEDATSGVTVNHLHGSLDLPIDLTTRINQIGRAGSSKRLEEIMRQKIKGRCLCVLGYSGNDSDIRKAIDVSGATNILWLIRDSSDYALQNILRLQTRDLVVFSEGDLSDLFDAVASLYSVDLTKSPNTDYSLDRERVLELWVKSVSKSYRFLCLSKVFLEVEDFNRSTQIALSGVLHTTPDNEADYKISVANILRVTAAFEDGLKIARDSIRLATAQGSPLLLARACNSLGLLLLEQEDMNPAAAAPYFREALEILEGFEVSLSQVGDNEFILILLSRVLNNLGMSLETSGDMVAASLMYIRSLRIKKKTGDLPGYAQTAANLSVLNYKIGKLATGRRWERKAFRLMDIYDH
jgi:tetratricopeptide (TPR) repeat protein